jgi:Peptidase A4 family
LTLATSESNMRIKLAASRAGAGAPHGRRVWMRKSLLLVVAVVSSLALSLVGVGAATASSSPAPGQATIVGVSPHAGAPSGLPLISENWSGYAAISNSKFTYAHSRFVQPSVKCTGDPHQNVSAWVGLDGFTSGTVEQDGTDAFCGGKQHTTPVYYAWYELFPAGSVRVFNVKPGDVIDATAEFTGGKFELTIADLTSHRSVTKTAGCASCERSSAEWIVERPAECFGSGLSNCVLDALPNFKSLTLTMNTAKTSSGGAAKPIGSFTNYPIAMIQPLNKGFISLDTAGGLNAAGDTFTVTWDRSGTPLPITF